MATSAFKSTTKRTPIGADGSAHRRSRSLSRFSHRISSPAAAGEFSDDVPAPRGRFVNTVRGSGIPEISLDDLAVEFFGSGDSSVERGRSGSRSSGTGPAGSGGSGAAQRRGRSVSRHGPRLSNGGDGKGMVSNGGGRLGSDNGGNSRRRRSVSVVRYQISDSESDLEHSQRSNVNPKSISNGSNDVPPVHKPKAPNNRQGLRRSFSQKDLRSCDGYSSQSSILTDDEGRDAHSSKFGNERTIRAVYAQNKAQHPTEDNVNGNLYEAIRTELRHAVAEIRSEFEHARGKTKPVDSTNGDCLLSNSPDVLQAVSSIMRNYSTKLEESEKRKQDLLSEIVFEEQRSRELSMIVKELLPDPKDNVVNDKPSRIGPIRRSTDRSKMSKRLSDEAEKYIEDFISNIEDTDISSLDGERSDTSSSIGGIMKVRTTQSPATPLPLPIDMDGVSLPWLKWETSNDATPMSCMNNSEPPLTPKTLLFDSAEVPTNSGHDRVILSASSRGSCSPGIIDSLPRHIVQGSGVNDATKSPQFDMDEYFKFQRDEDLLLERFRQQNRINSDMIVYRKEKLKCLTIKISEKIFSVEGEKKNEDRKPNAAKLRDGESESTELDLLKSMVVER